jgi:hypothetical protein
MVGHRAWPKVRPPVFDLMNPEDGPRLAEIIGRRKREILPKAIDQLAWLRGVHGGESRLAG